MSLLRSVGEFVARFHLFSVDDDGLKGIIIDRNFARIHIASIIGLVLSVLYAFVFMLGKPETYDAIESEWIKGITLIHILLLTAFSLFIWLTRPNQKVFRHNRQKWAFVFVAYLYVLFLTSALSLVDQLVITAIHAMLLGAISISIIVMLPPLTAFLAQLINFGFFLLIIPLVQTDRVVLISNVINALTASMIAALIHYTLWLEFIKRYQKSKEAANQAKETTRAYERLAVQANELREVVKQRDKLFALISHDLRSPFNALIGSSELLINDHNGLSEQEQMTLKMNMLRTSQSAFFLLENLLGWSLIQQHLMKIQKSATDLKALINQAINDCHHLAEAKNVRIQVASCPEIQLFADHFMLQTAFRNLIMNAVKFSYTGGEVVVECVVDAEKMVNISFTDQGLGMEDALLNQLFRDNVPNRKGTAGENGMGIGLLLTYEFVSLHGGQIRVESAVGKGSCFTVQLPQSEILTTT